ncbi:peptidase M16 domain-containing protein [Chitinispirillum alkaliphilum]|nr:peptidase M16 domain-containing protein [Chitinispirillum alkaliphilum]
MLENVKEMVLQNGLKAVCLKKSDAPIVSVQVWYKTGSVCEQDGERGISHILEHMMFRGSQNIASEEHARRINDCGGHCNAFTAEDVTAYLNSVPAEYLDTVLELEAERMSNLRIDNDLFETERMVIVEEYHSYMNNPVAKAFLKFREEFFRGNPYALSPLGLLDDIQRVTAEKCGQYYSRWYRPDNAVIVVVGDVSDENHVFDRIEHHFGAKTAGESPGGLLCDIQFQHAPGVKYTKSRVDFNVPILIAGYPAPPSSHSDALPLEILQLVLSGGESGRLHREMVRKQSVAVMSAGMNHLMRKSGMSMFFAAFTPDVSVSKVEKALKDQIRNIASEGITEDEFEKVKNTTLTNRTFELYSAEGISQRIGYSEAFEGDYRIWIDRLNELKKLDRNSLVQIARKYWSDSDCHTLYLKPRRMSPVLYVAGLAKRIFKRD